MNDRSTSVCNSKCMPGLSLTSGPSPIDLNDKRVRKVKLPPLVLDGHWLNDGEAILSNSGKYAEVSLSGYRIPSIISGGPLLNDTYSFDHLHFHWGETDCRGGEHTINGSCFSMEAHAVHFNQKYSDFDSCLEHKDGICVLAFVFLVQGPSKRRNNPHLEKITNNLKYIVDENTEINIPANSLYWMQMVTRCSRYYTYYGSLTDKPDEECVTWVVFPETIPLHSRQIDEFRQLRDRDGHFIKSNWNELWNQGRRKVFLVV